MLSNAIETSRLTPHNIKTKKINEQLITIMYMTITIFAERTGY